MSERESRYYKPITLAAVKVPTFCGQLEKTPNSWSLRISATPQSFDESHWKNIDAEKG